MSAWLLLRRTLLYTAVTRARRLVVLVGSKRAVARAVRTEGAGAGRRYTAPGERLPRGQHKGPAQPKPEPRWDLHGPRSGPCGFHLGIGIAHRAAVTADDGAGVRLAVLSTWCKLLSAARARH